MKDLSGNGQDLQGALLDIAYGGRSGLVFREILDGDCGRWPDTRIIFLTKRYTGRSGSFEARMRAVPGLLESTVRLKTIVLIGTSNRDISKIFLARKYRRSGAFAVCGLTGLCGLAWFGRLS